MIREHSSANQFVAEVVIENYSFPGTGALDIFQEIDAGVTGAADGVMLDSRDDLLKLLFLPGTIPRVRHSQDFPDEVLEEKLVSG